MNGLLEWSTGLTFLPTKNHVYGLKRQMKMMLLLLLYTHFLLHNIKSEGSLYPSRGEGSSMDSLVPKSLGRGKSWVRGYSIDSRVVYHKPLDSSVHSFGMSILYWDAHKVERSAWKDQKQRYNLECPNVGVVLQNT